MRPVEISIPKNKCILVPARYGRHSNLDGYEDPKALKLIIIIGAVAATQRNYWNVKFQVSGSESVKKEFDKATISWQLYATTCKVAEQLAPGRLSPVEKVQLWQGTRNKVTSWVYANPIFRERLYKGWRATSLKSGFYDAINDLGSIIWKCAESYMRIGMVR